MKNLRRYFRKNILYLYKKIVREKASADYIARGWAIGMFYGCFLPFGTQLLFSLPTSFILKGSKIGACIGTLITNHFTVFIIYPVQCYVGSLMLGSTLSFSAIKGAMADVLKYQNWESLLQMGWELVLAFFIGGTLFAAIMTPLTYVLVKYMVLRYRKTSGGTSASA